MQSQISNRIIYTPSTYAKEHLLYVQETGTLQSLKPHISSRKQLDSLLFFIVTKGSGYLKLKGKEYHIETGDCIFINCIDEYSHESSKTDSWELSWVHFYGNEASELYKNYIEQKGSTIFHPVELTPFINALHNIYTELNEKNTCFEQKCHKYLTDIVTGCYSETISSPEQIPESHAEKIQAVKKYLDENFQKEIDLDYLSEIFFISKFHLSREFKKLTGTTIINYLNSKRINEAKQLLRFTNQSIGEIAISCGIDDMNYFTKVFCKYESITPSNYRKLWH